MFKTQHSIYSGWHFQVNATYWSSWYSRKLGLYILITTLRMISGGCTSLPAIFSLPWATSLGTSKVDVPQNLCIHSIGPAQCVIILIIFILFFSAQAIIWSVWCNSFLLFFQFFIHYSRMGICTSLITSYTALGCFCYLLGFHLCNIFTLMVSNYYKL